MKKKFYQRILILSVLVLLGNALVPGVACGQQDSIVISKTILTNNSVNESGGIEFGTAVAVDGSTIVGVGAILADGGADHSGAAYLISPTNSNNFLSQTTPPHTKLFEKGDAKTGDHFGNSLAISGDALVIGAPLMDDGDETNAGAAYVVRFSYDETTEVWTIFDEDTERLTPTESSAEKDEFGYSVAISGDTAVVGTYKAEAVYVFEHDDSGWSQKAKPLIAWDAQGGIAERFGISVAIDGDTLVVGAIKGGDNDLRTSNVYTGSVYVFNRDGSDWVKDIELFTDDLADNDQFGYSVALEGDTLVVGAPRHDDGVLDSGAAYVFRRNAGTWSRDPEAKLIGSGLFEKAYFGSSVALSGNTAVVGAYRNDLEKVGTSGTDSQVENKVLIEEAGSAYVFRFDASKSQWDQKEILTLDNPKTGEEFGRAVAISGDTVVVGAPEEGDLSGSAYVYSLVPENHPPVADAGENIEVEEGTEANLDGSQSYDLDIYDSLEYLWTQTGGPPVELGTTDEATLTFTAPPWSTENEKLTFQLEVKDESGAASTDEVEVTVLPSTESVSEITAVLGSEHHHSWGTDKDIFNFHGTEGDKVTITLKAKTGGKNNHGDRATLKLKDNIRGVSFYRVDSSRLPNHICATLPATGQYHILVAGQPRFFRGKRFLGEYTLTLEGASGSLKKGAGPPVVHQKPGYSGKPHTQHPVWSWISSWFRH